MPDIRRIAVADDVGFPFVLGCVGVAGADVAGLQGFEVLEGAEFVGHFLLSVGWVFCDEGVLWLLYVPAKP